MPHTRKKKRNYEEHKEEHFKVDWDTMATAIMFAIESGDLSYRDFKKAQYKIDLKFGRRPLEIKPEIPSE